MEYGLSLTTVKLKVYEIMKSRWTPSKNGILGARWLRWWQRRHSELNLIASQALDTVKAGGLCEENVKSFYDNLQEMYTLHEYPPERICNCDKLGA